MKINRLMLFAVIAAIAFSSCTESGIKTAKVKTAQDSIAYAVGVNNYYVFLQFDSMQIDPVMMAKGYIDSKNGESAFDYESANLYIQEALNKIQMEMMKKEYGKNIEEGEKFLAENKKREGVIETASGLQYEVLTMGTGEKPGPSDKVKVHYTGTFLDGNKFDSSIGSEPYEFAVNQNQSIKGFDEAVQLMSVGSKYKVFIPYELAYGERGAQRVIPPYSTLIFEIELLEIVK